MKLGKVILAGVSALAFATSAQAVTYAYAGSWSVGDGPEWTDNPQVYTAQEAAALLFGGVASDYAISTLGTDANLIDFQAHVDGWADDQYLFSGGATVSQSFSLDTGGFGYNSNPGYQTAYSAYVRDHSNAGDPRTLNYAFRIAGGAVPEPATWAFLVVGFGLAGGVMRRRAANMAVSFA